MVAEKDVEVPGRQGVKPGTVLYKVLWKDFPPEIATWENADTIHQDFIDNYEERICAEEEAEAAERMEEEEE